jgi:nucleoside-diphosphate-sugar epimerase
MSGREAIPTVEQLEELLSEPGPGVIETLGQLEGDLLVLGVNGKMGPTLARMAKRAFQATGARRRVVGVSRFSASDAEARLQALGIETIRCDLLHPEQLACLPDVSNVVYMVGMKFGSTGQEGLTWAMNSYLPGMVSQKFRHSRIVAFSTGNVYGLTPVHSGGSLETDPLHPVGDYAMSCVGRERIFQHFSTALGIPMALIRLNYAAELRYGVLLDLAQRVQTGQVIDLTMGHFNVIWQADANAMALRAFDHTASPPFIVNVSGPELLSVRRIAEQFGRLLDKPVMFRGTEAPDAFLSNGQLGHRLFGYPRVSVQQMVIWIAEWIKRDGPTLGKPTHFEARDGTY